LKPSKPVAYDGRSLQKSLSGADPIDPQRVLVAHHQELPDPEKYRFASVMEGPWRLVLRNDLPEGAKPGMELYRVANDPGQFPDRGAPLPDSVSNLRRRYDAWWDDISRDFDRTAEIVVGDSRQNPTELTCFEWHSSQQWGQGAVQRGFDGNGYWALRVAQA